MERRLGGNPSTRPSSGACITRKQAESAQLFRGADLNALWPLLETCPVRALTPGEVLIAQGQMDRDVYVLLEGRLEVRLASTGNEVVATIEPGQAVGELAPIDHRPRSATIVAATSSRALSVAEETFWALLRCSHAFALNVLATLCERLRGMNVTLTEGKRLQQELEQQATVDALTQIGNRRWLDKIIEQQVRWARNQMLPLSAIMIDIDHFKQFNDEHGHSAGDRILRFVARLLRTAFRPTDHVARYGGEEFTVLLPGTSLPGACIAADRVREKVHSARCPLGEAGDPVGITISLGVAELRTDEDAASLLARADQALYQAKHEGRNRACATS